MINRVMLHSVLRLKCFLHRPSIPCILETLAARYGRVSYVPLSYWIVCVYARWIIRTIGESKTQWHKIVMLNWCLVPTTDALIYNGMFVTIDSVDLHQRTVKCTNYSIFCCIKHKTETEKHHLMLPAHFHFTLKIIDVVLDALREQKKKPNEQKVVQIRTNLFCGLIRFRRKSLQYDISTPEQHGIMSQRQSALLISNDNAIKLYYVFVVFQQQFIAANASDQPNPRRRILSVKKTLETKKKWNASAKPVSGFFCCLFYEISQFVCFPSIEFCLLF